MGTLDLLTMASLFVSRLVFCVFQMYFSVTVACLVASTSATACQETSLKWPIMCLVGR